MLAEETRMKLGTKRSMDISAQSALRSAAEPDFLNDLNGDCDLSKYDLTVTVLGAGGNGSWLALALAESGVKNFRILEPDRVELSNLDRQIAYCPEDVGRYKADVLAERIPTSTP